MKWMTKCICALWAALVVLCWFSPAKKTDDAERRPLAQRPSVSWEQLSKGSFQKDFEKASLDQFPLRQSFRQLKALFHTYVLGQKDNNGIYVANGIAVGQEYPLKEASINHAISRLNALYHKYLQDSSVYMAIIPDKNYYLAEPNGQLSLPYDTLFAAFQEGLPFAQQIDLTHSLTAEAYYRTDTHWRQELLIPAAQTICNALGVTAPLEEDFRLTRVERPFYGVYYGQAALPMEPDTLYYLENDLLSACTVYDFETDQTLGIYDSSKLDAKDLYEIFLSGPKSLLTIENPNAKTDRELIVFRDSFGSSITPLLLQDYKTVTLADLRYLQQNMLGRLLDFHGQDVLILYSALVLNNGETIK